MKNFNYGFLPRTTGKKNVKTIFLTVQNIHGYSIKKKSYIKKIFSNVMNVFSLPTFRHR